MKEGMYMEVIIVSGLSGSGKSQAVNALEDLGYYCVDNMPPVLVKNFIELSADSAKEISKAAFVIDVRGGVLLDEINVVIDYLNESQIPYNIIFLEASDRVLLNRYNETRRNHPLAGGNISTADAIRNERQRLKMLRDLSGTVIDTSNMKPADLYREIKEMFMTGKTVDNFTINVMSFGYKKGVPLGTDMIFDVRFIPNPYYIPELKEMTGKDAPVKKYVLKQSAAKSFLKMVSKMIEKLIPSYINEGKYHLNIAFGCTGGQHRSVAIAEEMARILDHNRIVTLTHRDS